jgi:hypothetical protein
MLELLIENFIYRKKRNFFENFLKIKKNGQFNLSRYFNKYKILHIYI